MYPDFNSYFNPRGRKKFYISFIELVSWAYEITDKTESGETYHDAKSRVQALFNKAQVLFNGTKTYEDPQQIHDTSEETHTTHYPTIIDPQDTTFILEYYIEYYSERLLEQPVEPGKFNLLTGTRMDYNAAMYFILDKIEKMIDKFITINQEKYLRRLVLLNLKYNPIDNYDGHEVENLDYEGKETLDREVKASQLSGVKITGPSSDAKINYPSNNTSGSLEGGFDTDYKKTSAVAQVGDTVNGSKAGDATVNEASGTTTASTTETGGSTPTSNHYTTTYDNAATSRLESYDTNTGTVATSQKGTSSEDVPTMIEAYSGSPNSPSYKDTKDYEDRTDKRNLTKWGNMGTMTTQNMIEQEVEMLEHCWNVVEDFMEDLNHYIFLGVY